MANISEIESVLSSILPQTYAILKAANFVVHPAVSHIILHGSRGLAGKPRINSDLDLSLIVDIPQQKTKLEIESFLYSVYDITQSVWQSTIELDLAIVFDIRNCGLKCFSSTSWNEHLCTIGGIDCFGLFKVQKGYNGIVTNAGIQVKQMYPCLQIWCRT